MRVRSVLVTGATGNQGGAVVRALADTGHRIRALVRDRDDSAARALGDRGIEVVAGDYGDEGSLSAALSGIETVFAVTTPAGGVEAEVGHGKARADGAARAGVEHLVFSSVGDADRATGIGHFDSKYAIETHIRGLDVPWTVTAPAFFFENVRFPWNAADLREGRFRQALPATRKLKQISVRDVGRFNALVIDQGDRFVGQRINIAGDAVTGAEMAAALSAAIGGEITFEEQSLDEVRTRFDDMATMYEWVRPRRIQCRHRRPARCYPEVGWLTVPEWAVRQGWPRILAEPGREGT